MTIVYKTDLEKEFFTGERCHIIEILNDPDRTDISIARASVDPGQQTQLHALINTEEIYYVLEGSGILTIGEQQTSLTVGDCIVIAKDQPQSIKNTGEGSLRFLCICRPAFRVEVYKELGP